MASNISQEKHEAGPFTPLASVRPTIGQRIRAYFLTGIVIAGPLAVTVFITTWIIGLIDAWFKPLIPTGFFPAWLAPYNIPGLGLIIAFVSLTLLGFLTANLVGRWMIGISETILGRMPVVRGIYKGMKQVFETLFSQSGTSFRKVGLIEYPGKGLWSIVFISAAPEGQVLEALPGTDEYISCFLPCSPNPTTGFFLYLKKSEVVEVGISIDDAAKLVMSAGLIQPTSASTPVALSNPASIPPGSA
jgi:uncharacterized membrane protein